LQKDADVVKVLDLLLIDIYQLLVKGGLTATNESDEND
jgi:hypothetical protein